MQQLLDERDILACVHRYCRGVDRLDEALVRSAYHSDAIDDHAVFRGSVDEFIMWAFAFHRERHLSHQHYVTNHTAEIVGDIARSETYFVMAARNRQGASVTLHGGRYVDRFERRRGLWRIAHRVSMVEWVGGLADPKLPMVSRAPNGTIARDLNDTSYDDWFLRPDIG
ncbi:hypothetical protein A5689_17550 [Mycobacterium intracellulare subsp. yongonense]|nr:hypothetical protein A5689_17550 [Mycobacterium intracellulare subsp. yongonense]